MTWRIEWTSHALKDARRLDRPIRERIVEAIERLAEAGQGDVVRLQAPLSGYRLGLEIGVLRLLGARSRVF
jgi:mRNA-degrading endonuclease RelE of RelBE toxin-antitoxin system